MGATGRLALSCLGSSTMTLPPQQSTAASMPGKRAGGEIGVAPAGAEADHADLAVGIGLRAQELHAAGDVAHHLLVGDAAGRAHARAHVVRAAGAFAEIEVRRDGRQSVMGELAGRLFDPFVPARHVMDQRPRRATARRRAGGRNRLRPRRPCDRERRSSPRAYFHMSCSTPRARWPLPPAVIIQVGQLTGRAKIARQGVERRGATDASAPALIRDIDRARPCRSGPDRKSRRSCRRAA